MQILFGIIGIRFVYNLCLNSSKIILKAVELRQKSKPELEKLLEESRKRLLELRFDLVAGKLKNIREIRKIKKDIARIMTILKEKL